jgi:hypothetical protein
MLSRLNYLGYDTKDMNPSKRIIVMFAIGLILSLSGWLGFILALGIIDRSVPLSLSFGAVWVLGAALILAVALRKRSRIAGFLQGLPGYSSERAEKAIRFIPAFSFSRYRSISAFWG